MRSALARRLGRLAAPPDEVNRSELAFYVEHLRAGMTVLDVGANVGELTVLFSRLVGDGGAVHAFEPTRAADRLETACAALGRRNVVVNRVAVGATAGRATLHVYDDEHLSWSSFVERPLADYGLDVSPPEAIEVDVVALDDYCAAAGVDRVDLLKIDVEGAEVGVLRGARGLLASHGIACCVFEWGQTTVDAGYAEDDLRAQLESAGYEVASVVRGDRPFPRMGGRPLFAIQVARARR